ncbi:DUF3084 domain-containing protein [Chroococcidiopsis sp. CCMEE 29]|uniref:DUF3084 domain-containing protein n=1 Tax=Chroococcidiopsis sp. CCMEE 29 TaxID=155894 RepID=UPI00202018CC|nr:DUF3084 domain-containing protein [Chroococcidiopsis sp. CCMEE 29]
MTTAYILIAAILILGGVIATVGDRLGTKVGKARLSLFNLRPRKTAVVVTILTGSIISASTLAILFAADERLRTGVFELEEIQRDLRTKREQLGTTRQQLEATNTEKLRVERELAESRAEQKAQQAEAQKRQAEAEQRLEEINRSLQAVIAKQAQTQAQLRRTQSELSRVSSQFQQAQARLKTVSQQARALRSEIQKRQAELQQLVEQRNELKAQIAQRDEEIAKLDQTINQRDREIADRNLVIAQRETRLKELEKQQEYLEQEAQFLERNLQVLRRGNVALSRGQVLAAGVVRIVKPSEARQAVDQLLREANRTAIQLTQPGIDQVSERLVRISDAQVDQIIKQIADGRDYVVRILSAGNYVLGEKTVQVFADVALNQLVFSAGDVLAAIAADPTTMSTEEIRQRVDLLLGASKFRAQRAGMIVGDTIQIGDNRIQTLSHFFEQLRQHNQPVELKAVAAEDTYTAGPLKVELVAVRNGQIVFSTGRVSEETTDTPEPIPTPQSSPNILQQGREQGEQGRQGE